jgi:hypothetical protein
MAQLGRRIKNAKMTNAGPVLIQGFGPVFGILMLAVPAFCDTGQ